MCWLDCRFWKLTTNCQLPQFWCWKFVGGKGFQVLFDYPTSSLLCLKHTDVLTRQAASLCWTSSKGVFSVYEHFITVFLMLTVVNSQQLQKNSEWAPELESGKRATEPCSAALHWSRPIRDQTKPLRPTTTEYSTEVIYSDPDQDSLTAWQDMEGLGRDRRGIKRERSEREVLSERQRQCVNPEYFHI